ncbi:DivIVA domain-containing protein [Bifidobacterium sp.]|uniref:DivIVA domain-containing protein n=1 Tax=Bifidobacterium sp. TaxID=41200 RepID=UPI003D7E49BB
MVSTITARELRNVRLTTTYLSEGYNIVEVNEFFGRCADALDGKAEMPPEEVERQMFTTVRFTDGYDIGQIDDLLDRIAETLRHPPVEEPAQPTQSERPTAQPIQAAQQPIFAAQQPAQQPIPTAQQPAQRNQSAQPFQQPIPQQPAQQTQPQNQAAQQSTQSPSAATGKGAIGAVLHEGNLFYGKFQWNGHQHVLITTKGEVLEIGPTDIAGFILQ